MAPLIEGYDMETDKVRHARMELESAVWISCGSHAWSCVLEDISATGVRVSRPEKWNMPVGGRVTMDIIVGDSVNIHMEAVVARITNDSVGLAYQRIPPDKEVELWALLGGYADTLEPWDDV